MIARASSEVKVRRPASAHTGAHINIDTTPTINICRTKIAVRETVIDVDNDGKFDLSTLEINTDGDDDLDCKEHRRDADGAPEQRYDNPLGYLMSAAPPWALTGFDGGP